MVRRSGRGQGHDAQRLPARRLRGEIRRDYQGASSIGARGLRARQERHRDPCRVRQGSGQPARLRSGARGGAESRGLNIRRCDSGRPATILVTMASPDRHVFASPLRRGVYEAIFRRRDMREFLCDPVPDEVLARVLIAAHHAASVGFSQPWDFVIVRDLERRREVRRVFDQERERNAAQFTGARREKFLSLKLEGILEAPLNLIVTCEPDRFGPGVLGKVSIADVEIYSACLAVENLWLAARAEGLGVGWVSILRNDALRKIFGIPDNVIPVAYLCVG